MSHAVFISYVEEDAGLAVALAKHIEDAGIGTWHYTRDSKPGPTYLQQVAQAIDQADVVVVLVSMQSLGAVQVTHEIVSAFEAGKKFLPLLLGVPHDQIKAHRRDWQHAFGAHTSLPVSGNELPALAPRIIDGIRELLESQAPAPLARSRAPLDAGANSACWVAGTGTLLNRLRGHQKPIAKVAVTPDGTRIASASSSNFYGYDPKASRSLYDGEIHVWDAKTGDRLIDYSGASPGLSTVTNDGTFAAAYEWYEAYDYKVVRGGTRWVKALSPDGVWFASPYPNIRIWRLPPKGPDRDTVLTQETEPTHAFPGSSQWLTFSRDGRWLASKEAEEEVKIWDVENGRLWRTLRGSADVKLFEFSPDGKSAATSDFRGPRDRFLIPRYVTLWDLEAGKEVMTLGETGRTHEGPWTLARRLTENLSFVGDGMRSHDVSSLDFSPDGTRIVAACGNLVRVIETATMKTLSFLTGDAGVRSALAGDFHSMRTKLSGAFSGTFRRTSDRVNSAVFCPDGRRIVSGGDDGIVRIWEP